MGRTARPWKWGGMNVSCPYYWWNHDYACRKSGKDVNEDVYYKYCRDYNYDSCPIYKQELPSDSACYLTTACIQARQLPDDCRELTVLPQFRDSYVRSLPEGEAVIGHYYAAAPKIVAAILALPDAQSIFRGIYEGLIVPCVRLIEGGDFAGAYERYKNMTLELERRYLSAA